MKKIEAHRAVSDSSGRNENASSRKFTTMVWAGFGLRELTRPLCLAAAAIFAIGLLAEPASAQDLGAGDWKIQGGPSVGVTHIGHNLEYGFRLGAQRGAMVLDASASTFAVYSYVPGKVQRHFEALAGMEWQLNLKTMVPGLGFRSGIADVPNGYGERFVSLVIGPHASIGVPLGSRAALRGEAGGLIYYRSRVGPGGPRGYIRIGLETRSK